MARKVAFVLSHWYHLIEEFQQSSQEFYASVEEAVKRRKVPNLRLSRVIHKEGGVLSAKREYLRVERKEYIFDICAAPFANGFFISWWLGECPSAFWSLILSIPYIGEMLRNIFKPLTYYQMDAALMFQELVRAGVLEVLDGLTKAKGVRALSENERKPILRDLYQRLK